MRQIDYNLGGYVDPSSVPGMYETGKLFGVMADPAETNILMGAPGVKSFYENDPNLAGSGKGKLSTPYKIVMEFEPEFGRYEAQTTGDCVSHSTRNAGMIDYCIDCKLLGNEYKGRFATENIYGWRGHGGQGANCSRLAKYTYSVGGFLVRQKYSVADSSVDLSRYNSRIGHNWGWRGTPSWLNNIAKANPSVRVSYISTINEARDAIANGYGISVCSNWGFSSRRDNNGVSSPRGRWAHAMAWVACDDTDWAHSNYGGPLFLVQNSWGRWNGGPKRHDQPDGSFWITHKTAAGMLSAGGSWVIAGVKGFERRHINYMLI